MVQALDLSEKPHVRKGPHEFGPVHAIWFVPALAIAAVLSIPVAFVASIVQKRREQSFKKQMKAAGRVMDRRDFELVLQEGRGTVIGESHSLKGPFRWWWTGENLYDICPFLLVTWWDIMPNDERYRPFSGMMPTRVYEYRSGTSAASRLTIARRRIQYWSHRTAFGTNEMVCGCPT